jgi:anti-sigma28 factor (negative regulator of flagellin synthesis)
VIFSGDAEVNRYLYVEESKYSDLLIKSLKKAIEIGYYQIEIEKMSAGILNFLTEEERNKVKYID